MKTVCLSILNYNGKKHLEHLLPTAIAAAKNYQGNCSVMVLDNRSPSDDVDWIRRQYPSVDVVVSPENDFLFSYNWLAEQRKEEVLVLLNNDLRLHPHFLEPLMRHMESPDVFAAGASSYDWEGKEYTSGPARIELRRGFYYWQYDCTRQEMCHTLFASGGFMAVDRRKFLDLGGFNRLFHPAYHEDAELCFRAWRKGWRCIYEPASVVWHRENATWSTSAVSNTGWLHSRNTLLFQWACLPMNHEVWQRRWSIAKLVLGGFLRLDCRWFADYLRTAWRWRQSRTQCAWMKVTDAELASINEEIAKPVPRLK